MLRKVLALTAIGLISTATIAKAAPVVATYIPATGNITFSGLTGEISMTLKSSNAANVVKANALTAGSDSVDLAVAGEVTYLKLGGYQGTLNAGNILLPGLNQQTAGTVSLVGQVDFAGTPFTGTVVGIPPAPPIPEPATFGLLGAGLLALAAARRRVA